KGGESALPLAACESHWCNFCPHQGDRERLPQRRGDPSTGAKASVRRAASRVHTVTGHRGTRPESGNTYAGRETAVRDAFPTTDCRPGRQIAAYHSRRRIPL